MPRSRQRWRGPSALGNRARKRADYFAAETFVVWDVDLLGPHPIRAFPPDGAEPRVFRRGELADAEPALPGWRMPVNGVGMVSIGSSRLRR
jgi:hypothetical protein